MSGELRCWDDEPGCNCANASPRSADVTREPTGGRELQEALGSVLGRVLAEHQTILYGVDERARCTCGWVGDASSWAPTLHRRDAVLALPEVAALLADADNWRRATTGDPTEPEPLAMQARTLLLRVRELEAQVGRVRELIAFYDRHEYGSLNVDDLRGALDGEPQP